MCWLDKPIGELKDHDDFRRIAMSALAHLQMAAAGGGRVAMISRRFNQNHPAIEFSPVVEQGLPHCRVGWEFSGKTKKREVERPASLSEADAHFLPRVRIGYGVAPEPVVLGEPLELDEPEPEFIERRELPELVEFPEWLETVCSRLRACC